MLLYTRRVDNFAIEVQQRLTVRKEKRGLGLDLSPDEHVFCGERNLLITFANIGSNRAQDLLLGQINLRVQVRNTKLATASTAGGHFDHTEGGSGIREENGVPGRGMSGFDLSRQILAADGVSK